MHVSTRDLVRRWYGQLRAQPHKIAADLKFMAVHTVAPSDPTQFSFGASDFAPLSQVMDLAMTSELNSMQEVVGLTLRAYRASFDAENNTTRIGGEDNFLLMKDLKTRPFRGGKGRIVDPDAEGALLLTAMEMEGEREAARRRSRLLRTPRFAEAVLSFVDGEGAPSYEVTPGLIGLAWASIQPRAEVLRTLCAPTDFQGVETTHVRAVHRDREHGLSFVELNNYYCLEAPSWARVAVTANQPVKPGQPLMTLGLPFEVLKSIWQANRSVEAVWDGLVSYVGEWSANWLLRNVYDSAVTVWAGMRMIPHYLVPQAQVPNASAVWRDLRGVLNRECHSHKNPSEVVRSGSREGRISVWNMGQPACLEALSFETLGGPVDLFSVPNRGPKAGVIYSAPARLFEESEEPLPVLRARAA